MIQKLVIDGSVVGTVKRYYQNRDRKSWIFVLDTIDTANEKYQLQVEIKFSAIKNFSSTDNLDVVTQSLYTKKYEVRFTDNVTPQDTILSFETEAKAEAAIEKDMQNFREAWADKDWNYGDFGRATEIWISGGDQYARWERLW